MRERAAKASVLVVHERYQEPGGEDTAVQADLDLLEAHGHRVAYYERHNDEIRSFGPFGQARLALDTVWSSRSRHEVAELLDRHRPDILHVHNTFPLISPAVYGAAAGRNVRVIQTLHNYRLLCANGALLRDGRLCHDCVGRQLPVPAVRHGCYRHSRPQSAVVTLMQTTHRAVGTWDRHIHLFLAVSEHLRRRLVGAGAVPEARTMVRRNHVSPDPGLRPIGSDQGYAVYVGRLSAEKGAEILVRAAALVPRLPVRIVGDGIERAHLERLAEALGATNVVFRGQLPRIDALRELRGARCVVLPSTGEDSMPLAGLEAAALGVPLIGSAAGGIPEAVDGGSGVLVPPQDPLSLAMALQDAAMHAESWQRRGMAARRHFEAEFSASRAYETLVAAYERVLSEPRAIRPASVSSA